MGLYFVFLGNLCFLGVFFLEQLHAVGVESGTAEIFSLLVPL